MKDGTKNSEKMILPGSDILVKVLIEQGCDTVFGYPGGQILNVYDSLYMHQDQIHHVLTAHEQGAVHAADGYARTTGKARLSGNASIWLSQYGQIMDYPPYASLASLAVCAHCLKNSYT